MLSRPSLGEVLHGQGASLAVIGCGTPGGNRILHHKAEALGGLNMSLHGHDQSATPERARALEAKFGPVPEGQIPNLERMDWLVDAHMAEVAPARDPTVTIIWFSDPDTPYHYRGIDSPEALSAIRHGDAAFGRLLAWRQASGRRDSLQIIALSDHGHVVAHGEPMGVAARMTAAGFHLGPDLANGADAVLVPGTTASLYVKNSRIQAAIARWLQDQTWCGPLFARDLDGRGLPTGALPLAACHLEHRRAGDIVFSLVRDGGRAEATYGGRCLHDNADIPPGCGLHGGLSKPELGTVFAFSGSRFATARRLEHPAGAIDLMPTLLHLLEIRAPQAMDGRALREAFSNAPPPPPARRHEVKAGNAQGYSQTVATDEVGGSRYLAGGWRDDAGDIDRIAR